MYSYVRICTHVRKMLCQEPIYSAISKCVELIYAFIFELCSVLSRNLCVQLVQTIIKIRAITGTRALMKQGLSGNGYITIINYP
jgi:hypothetical protein